jgi:hypothetical protein
MNLNIRAFPRLTLYLVTVDDRLRLYVSGFIRGLEDALH